MRTLLTGGAGYIGSHVALTLLERGHEVVILDDFSNSSPEAIKRVEGLCGRTTTTVSADLTDREAVRRALMHVEIDAVIHLAGLKSVGESVEQPTRYYRVNIDSTLSLLDLMAERRIERLVFSSSATVYGTPQSERIDEKHPIGQGLTNPYGRSKAMLEQILQDAHVARPELQISILRYFNPVGAHASGCIGEDPSGVPNNLMPYVAQVASGRRPSVSVYGDSYPTLDGTGVRDYVHVMDLAEGHVAALTHITPGVSAYNLGSGKGASVLEVLREYRAASGRDIPYTVVAERPGDVAASVADPTKANEQLEWHATRTLADACRDSWRWQSSNPRGFDS